MNYNEQLSLYLIRHKLFIYITFDIASQTWFHTQHRHYLSSPKISIFQIGINIWSIFSPPLDQYNFDVTKYKLVKLVQYYTSDLILISAWRYTKDRLQPSNSHRNERILKDSLQSNKSSPAFSTYRQSIRTETIANSVSPCLFLFFPPSSSDSSRRTIRTRMSIPLRGGVVPAERARLEPRTRDLSGVSRTPWVFSLFMWRNRIKSVAASRVAGWDYSRTVTGQVTPGIRCNRFFLADFSLPFSLPPRYTSSIQFSDPSGPTLRHDYRGNI